ncbi:MAG: anti-sigma factor [bacterium]
MESNSSCEAIKLLISAYFDNELSLKELIIVEEHLYKCQNCQRELEKIQKLSQILKDSASKIECAQLNLWSKVSARLDSSVPKAYPQVSNPSLTGIIKNYKLNFNSVYNNRNEIKLGISISGVIIIALLTWFSIKTVLINFNENFDKSAYSKSEEFLFAKTYSEPPEGVISILYENE